MKTPNKAHRNQPQNMAVPPIVHAPGETDQGPERQLDENGHPDIVSRGSENLNNVD